MGILTLAGGCAKTMVYDVSVKNGGGHPITIWLTKDGPPAEAGWLSPEQLASDPGQPGDAVAGVTVPPGKTASTGRIKGDFASGTNAILRIYEGEQKLADVLAISRGNPNRIDVILPPGKSDWTVQDSGPLRAMRNGHAAPTTR
jgi:hypothetical protein